MSPPEPGQGKHTPAPGLEPPPPKEVVATRMTRSTGPQGMQLRVAWSDQPGRLPETVQLLPAHSAAPMPTLSEFNTAPLSLAADSNALKAPAHRTRCGVQRPKSLPPLFPTDSLTPVAP